MTWRQFSPASSTSAPRPSSSASPRQTAPTASVNRSGRERSSGSSTAGTVDAEVVDPGRRGADPVDLVGPLVDDVDAHVLQHRQHVGQQQPLPHPVDREPALAGRRRRAASTAAAPAAPRSGRPAGRGRRRPARRGSPPGRRRGRRRPPARAAAPPRRRAARRARRRGRRSSCGPPRRARACSASTSTTIGFGGRARADRHADDEVQPGQHRLGGPGRVLDAGAAEPLEQQLLHRQPHLGRVAVARAGRPAPTRTGRWGPAAGTAGSGGAPAGAGRPARPAAARRCRPAAARRADRSRGRRAAPCRCGCRPARRSGRSPRPPGGAPAARRARWLVYAADGNRPTKRYCRATPAVAGGRLTAIRSSQARRCTDERASALVTATRCWCGRPRGLGQREGRLAHVGVAAQHAEPGAGDGAGGRACRRPATRSTSRAPRKTKLPSASQRSSAAASAGSSAGSASGGRGRRAGQVVEPAGAAPARGRAAARRPRRRRGRRRGRCAGRRPGRPAASSSSGPSRTTAIQDSVSASGPQPVGVGAVAEGQDPAARGRGGRRRPGARCARGRRPAGRPRR